MPTFLLKENFGMHLAIYNGGWNYFLLCFFKPLCYHKLTINYMKAVLKSIGGNTFDSWASGICLPLRMGTTDKNFGIIKRQVCDLKVPFFISTKILQGGGSNIFLPSTQPMSKPSPNTRIFSSCAWDHQCMELKYEKVYSWVTCLYELMSLWNSMFTCTIFVLYPSNT